MKTQNRVIRSCSLLAGLKPLAERWTALIKRICANNGTKLSDLLLYSQVAEVKQWSR